MRSTKKHVPARLDTDRTARPRSRIVGHAPVGRRWRGVATDSRPEYEDEKGERTALHEERRSPARRNPSARRGGVQSVEDYANFGTIYRQKDYFREQDDNDPGQIHYSHLEPLAAKDRIEADDILDLKYMSGSDYSGGSVTRANYESFMEEFGEVPGVISLFGSHGSYGVGVRIEAVSPEMIEVFEKLKNYPVIDEDKVSEVEMEWQDEAWKNWARSDFLRALNDKFPELEDQIEALAEQKEGEGDALYGLFEEAREKANVYWESENAGMHIDIERVVAKVDENDIPDEA